MVLKNTLEENGGRLIEPNDSVYDDQVNADELNNDVSKENKDFSLNPTAADKMTHDLHELKKLLDSGVSLSDLSDEQRQLYEDQIQQLTQSVEAGRIDGSDNILDLNKENMDMLNQLSAKGSSKATEAIEELKEKGAIKENGEPEVEPPAILNEKGQMEQQPKNNGFVAALAARRGRG